MNQRIPRFQIIDQIGQGQFSNVYKARIIPQKTPDNAIVGQNNKLIPPTNNPLSLHKSASTLNQRPTSDSERAQKSISNSSPPLIDFGADPAISKYYNTEYTYSAHNKRGLSNFFNSHQNLHQLTPLRETNPTTPTTAPIREQYVALKRVKFYEIQNSNLRTDCIKEVKLLQQLDHPNIINYSISFIQQNELYIVLEFADGGDLSKLINLFQKKKMLISEESILKYFSQVCSAVRYIHSKRILHRDIKPANIFMTSTGCVKLGDFGLGRFFGQDTRNAHSYVGTFYYMSPERIREWGYDFSSDVWSIGCVLYELITLYSPFSILYPHNSLNAPGNMFNNNQVNNNGANRNNRTNQNNHQQLQQVNPFNLQWIIDRILKANYPSLVPYTNISVELRNLAVACLSLKPADRPNMDYICIAVHEAQNRLEARKRLNCNTIHANDNQHSNNNISAN